MTSMAEKDEDARLVQRFRNIDVDLALSGELASRMALAAALSGIAFMRRHEIKRRLFKTSRWLASMSPMNAGTTAAFVSGDSALVGKAILDIVIDCALATVPVLGIPNMVRKTMKTPEDVTDEEKDLIDQTFAYNEKLRERKEELEALQAKIDTANAKLAKNWDAFYYYQEVLYEKYGNEWYDHRDEIYHQLAADIKAGQHEVHELVNQYRTVELNWPKKPVVPEWWYATPKDTMLYMSVAFMIGMRPELVPQTVRALGEVIKGLGEIIPL